MDNPERHTLRRLAKLRTSPIYSGRSDEGLIDHLEDALGIFLDYTHRCDDPGEPIDSLICDIARWSLGAEGAEGAKKAKDGDMEREWAETGIPATLEKRMKSYRQVVGVNASPRL